MKVHVLASGSKGNVTYIETENHKILFDLGMNLKYITEKLAEINVHPKEIDYIFISHDHTDHIGALSTFSKRYHPTICMTNLMFRSIPSISDYNHVLVYEDDIVLTDAIVQTIKTSHDTKDSRGFIITSKKESVVYLTDTGYLNQKLFNKLKNKDIYLFESNHDPEMLMNGKYPTYLKHRIFSSYGHLSNIDASVYLTKLIGPKTKKIILMHLSENNNTEEIALSTLHNTFKEHNIKFENIICAKQRERVVAND